MYQKEIYISLQGLGISNGYTENKPNPKHEAIITCRKNKRLYKKGDVITLHYSAMNSMCKERITQTLNSDSMKMRRWVEGKCMRGYVRRNKLSTSKAESQWIISKSKKNRKRKKRKAALACYLEVNMKNPHTKEN